MLIQADARRLPLDDQYVQCCICSPPYWGLRSYGTAPLVWGGESGCEHMWDEVIKHRSAGGPQVPQTKWANVDAIVVAQRDQRSDSCARCGAWRGSLGLEPTPDLYVQHLIEVFREIWRVLKDDGTAWIVIGDSYAGSWGNQGRKPERGTQHPINGPMLTKVLDGRYPSNGPNTGVVPEGLKPKDLVGIPWSVAFALRADGWYLRSEIIWAKAHEFCPGGVGSTMPESVSDRPTRAHETVFLLTKRAKYFYNSEAVKQNGVFPAGTRAAKGSGTREGNRRGGLKQDAQVLNEATVRKSTGFNDRYFHADPDSGYAVYSGKRALRDVWFISPQSFKGAHFATFPPKLVEPCLLAGSAHWQVDHPRSVVLDPFCGSGTVGVVARQHGRFFIGCDLKPEYLAMARQRIG